MVTNLLNVHHKIRQHVLGAVAVETTEGVAYKLGNVLFETSPGNKNLLSTCTLTFSDKI